MPVNHYFQGGNGIGNQNEKRLYEDLIVEGLKIYGHNVYYLPRTLVNRDLILGEDTTSRFDDSWLVEMYIESTEGFAGQQEIIDNLPRQHSLDYANKTSDNIYPVSPLIKEGFEPFVTLYINGTKVPKVETNDVNLDGFYIFPARNQIRVLGSFVSSISSSASVYLFYTEQSA